MLIVLVVFIISELRFKMVVEVEDDFLEEILLKFIFYLFEVEEVIF